MEKDALFATGKLIKMSFFLTNLIYRFNTISVKISAR